MTEQAQDEGTGAAPAEPQSQEAHDEATEQAFDDLTDQGKTEDGNGDGVQKDQPKGDKPAKAEKKDDAEKEGSDKKVEDGKAEAGKDEDPIAKRTAALDQDEKDNRFSEGLLSARPDAFEVADSKEFQDWLKSQPKAIQDAAMQTEDWGKAVQVLDMFDKAASKGDGKGASQETGKGVTDLESIKFKGTKGDEITIADFRKEYGDDVANAMIALVQNAVGKGGAEKPGAKTDDSRLVQLQEKIDAMQFRMQVMEFHPNAQALVKSKEWGEWYKAQPAAIQRLWKQGPSPDDAIAVLDKFKKDEAERQAQSQKGVARKRKDQHDEFHGSTLQSGKGGPEAKEGSGDDEDVDEAEKEFNVLTGKKS